eukprot:COSAG05_NODE_1679_length_4291_cov_102.969704_5_plen_82_part_00
MPPPQSLQRFQSGWSDPEERSTDSWETPAASDTAAWDLLLWPRGHDGATVMAENAPSARKVLQMKPQTVRALFIAVFQSLP